MKNLLLGTLFALSGIVGATPLAKAAEYGCVPVGAAQARAEAASEANGGTTIRLDGESAERFLDYINDKVGRHTEYWGNGVIIERYPALGYDAIAIVDDGCVDETKLIRLDPQTTAFALDASQNAFE